MTVVLLHAITLLWHLLAGLLNKGRPQQGPARCGVELFSALQAIVPPPHRWGGGRELTITPARSSCYPHGSSTRSACLWQATRLRVVTTLIRSIPALRRPRAHCHVPRSENPIHLSWKGSDVTFPFQVQCPGGLIRMQCFGWQC